jgi:outer membrane cobalamin receptor
MSSSCGISRLTRLVVVAGLCAACHGATTGLQPLRMGDGSRWITPDIIARATSTNAWDLLRECGAGYHIDETSDGRAVRIGSRRGRSSLLLKEGDMLLLVIDGVRMSDARYLRELPTSTVLSIQLLNGIDGTTYFGSNAGAGVILVTTKIREAEPPPHDSV